MVDQTAKKNHETIKVVLVLHYNHYKTALICKDIFSVSKLYH